MVNRSRDQLSAGFAALADPTRRAIVERLTRGSATVGELATPFDVSLPAISKHLAVLESAGLIVRESDGRARRCRLVEGGLTEPVRWIAEYGRFWEGRLEALEGVLGEDEDGDG